MNLTDLSDDDLDNLRVNVLIERERRQTLATVPAQADDLARRYRDATGVQDGDPWTQPQGAHDAHPEGWTVTHNGKTWVSLIPANVWEPGTSGWREVTDDDGAPAEWVQPSGAHDIYGIGDRVTFQGAVWESVLDGNVWSPTAHPAGWKKIN